MSNGVGMVIGDTANFIMVTVVGRVAANGTVIAMAIIMTAVGEIIATGIDQNRY